MTTSLTSKNMPEVADSYESPGLMNSSSRTSSSLISFKIVACNDDSVNEDGRMSRDSMGNESILASSQQNSTWDLPTSAPSSIARNKILASSTPKENGTKNGGTPKLGQIYNKENAEPVREYSEWSNDRRLVYRTQKMRNLAAPVQPLPNLKSTYPKEYINLQAKLEEHRRREISFETHARQSRDNIRAENIRVIKDNLMEFILSIFLTAWQLFYMSNLIPNDYRGFQAMNIAINGAFALFFMAPVKIWWFIVAASLFFYLSSAWVFGVTVSVTTFAFVAVLARALASVFQFGFLILQ